MDKKSLITTFVKILEDEITVLTAAALATRDAATNEESKPENQYDTRALEASYLAGAQAKRVFEINEVITLFHTSKFIEFTAADPVALTALVTLKLDGKKSTVLMMPKGGGVSCSIAGETVQIVTPSSALGEAIIGLTAGSVAEFEIGPHVRECEIVSVS
jgi:hypothetical protein